MRPYAIGEQLYANPLAQPRDIDGWIREGTPVTSFPQGAMRLENGMDPSAGQAANYLFWCPVVFPANAAISWSFRPIREPGLAMMWFSATGTEGRDLFDPALAPRDGQYRQYHSGDVDGYHASYFRRKNPSERAFHTCNLRKSHGFHLVCQGGDPIPDVIDVDHAYRIQVVKLDDWIRFRIDDLDIYTWHDDGSIGGPAKQGGRIGFRQMAPLVAEYADLQVHAVVPA